MFLQTAKFVGNSKVEKMDIEFQFPKLRMLYFFIVVMKLSETIIYGCSQQGMSPQKNNHGQSTAQFFLGGSDLPGYSSAIIHINKSVYCPIKHKNQKFHYFCGIQNKSR
jgi:hypothetical protein